MAKIDKIDKVVYKQVTGQYGRPIIEPDHLSLSYLLIKLFY